MSTHFAARQNVLGTNVRLASVASPEKAAHIHTSLTDGEAARIVLRGVC
jgi:hypothetical protein